MKSWRERYADGKKGICDFGLNYDFYFKWLTNKVASCLTIRGAPDSINETYLKTNLILDGNICITDFNEKLYACIGGWGGEPDEYYIPTIWTVANPILGSKTVKLKGEGKDGVVISNTQIDGLGVGLYSGGLYDLIHQTATLLADNIISINCMQINTRVEAIFTADSEAQAVTGEAVLKKLYAGSPFQILRQDIVNKITVNPISKSGSAQTLTQLVELHNYIISNFFQAIGIKANNIMKKERLITGEIDSQDDFVALSLLEMAASWQKGLDEVNDLFGTDMSVEINPVLVHEIADSFIQAPSEATESDSEPMVSDTTEPIESDTEQPEQTESIVDEETAEPEPETVEEVIEEQEDIVQKVLDAINDTEKEEGGEVDVTDDEG